MTTNPPNATRNQHYVSQVEQRLNTSTPQASTKNQRIFEFDVLGRFEKAELGNPRNPRIRANLALDDVFSFDVQAGTNLRRNFETLFHRYEGTLNQYTEAVTVKAEAKARADEIKDDLMGLFAAKLLNFLRNPYSVPKVLDTFKRLTGLRPTDTAMNQQLDLVLSGNKPHQAEICKRLGLSELQYQYWLGVLFMMLTSFESSNGNDNFFDGVVRSLFNNKTTGVGVMICRYTQDKCLLSDRSFSSSIAEVGVDCIEFNLRHDSFIRFVFANRAVFLPTKPSPRQAAMLEMMKPTLAVDYRLDDRGSLAVYNLNVINQSHSRVFCCVDKGIVVGDR